MTEPDPTAAQHSPAQSVPPAQASIAAGEQSRISASAVASLVLGILGCVPLITSLLGVICAIIGFRATRDPRVRGRGLAIAGLVLGLVGLLLWGIFGGSLLTAYISSGPARAVAKQFLQNVNSGDFKGAANQSTLSDAELQQIAAQMTPLGSIRDTTVSSFFVSAQTGAGITGRFKVSVQFAKGSTVVYQIDMTKTPHGWKVVGVHWQ